MQKSQNKTNGVTSLIVENKNFAKAKNQAIKYTEKELERFDSPLIEKALAGLKLLETYPTDSKTIRYLDVAAKAKLLKAQLMETFPENTFKIRTERYSGGASIEGSYKGPKINQEKLRQIENLYQDSGNTDTQIDYFDYDNYCNVTEDLDQRIARLAKCPKCSECGMQTDVISITNNDEILCQVCTNNGKYNCFKKMLHEVEV